MSKDGSEIAHPVNGSMYASDAGIKGVSKDVSVALPKYNLKSGILEIGERTLVFPKNKASPRRILWIKNTSPNHAILLKATDSPTASAITIDPDSEKYFEFHMIGFTDKPDENGIRKIVGICEWMDDVYLENAADSIVYITYQAMELIY